MPGALPAAVAPLLPAFCRVAATLKPSLDSDIKIEVWLPADDVWNRKYLAVGGGGWVGSINHGAMATAVQEGYATSSTDTGHIGGTAEFAVGHPEKVTDFAYRAVHEMTVKAKAIIAAHYGRSGPDLSYGLAAPPEAGRASWKLSAIQPMSMGSSQVLRRTIKSS